MKVDVLYQFNEKYAPYAGVSITSLFENNKNTEEIHVYILGDRISGASRKKLLDTGKKYNRSIYFLDTEELIKVMKQLNIPTYRGSYAANLKLFIPMVIAENIDRLLYIDSDTVVTGNIEELFKTSMEDKPLAMALDSLGVKHKRLIGLSETQDYYNTGVMLFDLKQWKKEMCTEQLIEHVSKVRAHYMSPDQDLVNVVLYDRIYRLNAEYNLQPIHAVYNYRQFSRYFGQQDYYTQQEIEAAVGRPVIIHFFRFLGEFPWDEGAVHPDREIFDRYLEMSLWKDYVKRKPQHNSIVFKIERWMYKHLDRNVFLLIFKLNYDIFLKRAERDSRRNKNNGKM